MEFRGKNILLIIHQGYLGGAERQGLSISKVLTEEHDCNVYLLLTYSGEMSREFKEFAEECHVKDIFHFGQPYFLLKREITIRNLKRLSWSLRYLLKIKKGITGIKPEVIIPFLNFPSKISYYLYKLLPDVKYTFWHQLGLDTWSNDVFEKFAARNVPLVIANAPNGIEIFNEKYPRNIRECHVLPQFPSLEYVELDRRKLREKYNIPETSLVITMVAHYRPEKMQELLFTTFMRLEKELNDITLIFLGNDTGEKVKKLRMQVDELELFGRVKVLSDFPVPEILNLADIGVLVSKIEGVPNAVMEYMEYGLPIVCTDHPGCKLLMEDSRFLIQNEEDQLYFGLKALLLSKELRMEEGRNNQERIKSFNKFSYIDKLEDILSGKYSK